MTALLAPVRRSRLALLALGLGSVLLTGCPVPTPIPASRVTATVTGPTGAVADYSSVAGDVVNAGAILLGSPHGYGGSSSTVWATINAPSVDYTSGYAPEGADVIVQLQRSDAQAFAAGSYQIGPAQQAQPIRLSLISNRDDTFCVASDGTVTVGSYTANLVDRNDLVWYVATGQVTKLRMTANMDCYTRDDMLSGTVSTMKLDISIG